MSRLRAEMTPTVTVWPRPNGLPIATTQSPTRASSESPNDTNGRATSAVTRSTARSVAGSRPTTVASNVRPSWNATSIASAPSMTWLLVTITPSGSMTKPEPSEDSVRGAPPRYSLKRSSGEPGGNVGRPPATFWLVRMFTTAGESRSERSAKPSISGRCAAAGAPRAAPARRAAARTPLMLSFACRMCESRSSPQLSI